MTDIRVSEAEVVPKTYHRSAILSAFVRLWRGWTVLIPVIVVNALLQAVLVWPDYTPDATIWNALSAVLSGIVFLTAVGLVTAVALRVPDGRVTWRDAWGALRAHLGAFALWAIALTVVVSIGFALWTIPGLLVLALTPFLLVAVIDGRTNAVAANFRTLGRRFWRWLVTVVIVSVIVLVGNIIAGFTAFFIRGAAASAIVWLVAGFILTWASVAFALIYRNAWFSHPEAEEAVDPDLESTA